MPLSLHTPGSSKTSQGQSHGREGKNARFALLLPLCAAVTRTAETVQEGAPPPISGEHVPLLATKPSSQEVDRFE